MVYFYLEDIIGNAIIELNKIDGSRKVSICVAKEYGEAVVKKLCKQGYYANIKNINDCSILIFEQKYSKYFKSFFENGVRVYLLKDDISIDDLFSVFRKKSYLEIWSVFSDEEIVSQFLIPYIVENANSDKNVSSFQMKEVEVNYHNDFVNNEIVDVEHRNKKMLLKGRGLSRNGGGC